MRNKKLKENKEKQMKVKEISENGVEWQTNEINYRPKRKRCSFRGWRVLRPVRVLCCGWWVAQVGGLSKATIMPKRQTVVSRRL